MFTNMSARQTIVWIFYLGSNEAKQARLNIHCEFSLNKEVTMIKTPDKNTFEENYTKKTKTWYFPDNLWISITQSKIKVLRTVHSEVGYIYHSQSALHVVNLETQLKK
jgi:hypothetical protein